MQAADQNPATTQNEILAPTVHPIRSKNKIDLATEVHARITHSLATRTLRRGTRAAKLEEQFKRGGSKLWSVVRKRPYVGVILVGGAALTLATVVGGGELTFTAIVGYAAYQVFREGVAPATAANEMFKAIAR